MKVMYTHVAIDVWGSAKEGYDINEMIFTRDTLELDADVLSDKDLIKAVRKSLGHRADARGYYVDIADESIIYIHRNSDSKPCYVLMVR